MIQDPERMLPNIVYMIRGPLVPLVLKFWSRSELNARFPFYNQAGFSLELVGVVDVAANDETLFDIVSNAHKDLPLYSDLSSCLQAVEADTMVDFTNPTSVLTRSEERRVERV